MTWRQLQNLINNLPDEQLDMTATVHDFGMDECYEVVSLMVTNDQYGVLDANHPVMFVGLAAADAADVNLSEYGLEPVGPPA